MRSYFFEHIAPYQAELISRVIDIASIPLKVMHHTQLRSYGRPTYRLGRFHVQIQ